MRRDPVPITMLSVRRPWWPRFDQPFQLSLEPTMNIQTHITTPFRRSIATGAASALTRQYSGRAIEGAVSDVVERGQRAEHRGTES